MKALEFLAVPCLLAGLVVALLLPLIRRMAEREENVRRLKERGIIR